MGISHLPVVWASVAGPFIYSTGTSVWLKQVCYITAWREGMSLSYHVLPGRKETQPSTLLSFCLLQCDNCGVEPIQGVRWHCQDCPPEMSLDFCDSCSDCPHETDIHKEDHQLEPVYKSETFLDRDYCVSQGTSYSYLDPNYFPANRWHGRVSSALVLVNTQQWHHG